MQNLFNKLIAVCFLAAVLTSCQKGDAGPTGPQGVTGNANVITYTYGSQTFTGALNLTISNISQGRVDSSLVLVYYNPSTEAATAWYACPGLGSIAAYDTRYLFYQTSTSPSTYTMSIRTMTPAGASYTSAVTFTKIRIILALSSSIVTGGRSGQPPLDLSDYNAVKKYYNLAD